MIRDRRPLRRYSLDGLKLCAGILISVLAAGCSSFGGSGPTSRAVLNSADTPLADAAITVIPLSEAVARQIVAAERSKRFSDIFVETDVMGSLIGRGDILEITLWEAPPAVLFGSVNPALGSAVMASSNNLNQPGQVVDERGMISVPFAGSIQAAGRTPAQIEHQIVSRLRGKANQPQATVRLIRNQATNVTVVGDVGNSGRLPLTPKGERLLDVLAAAGGVRNPVSKTMIQVTRGNRVAAMPLETVIRDPEQNIVVQPDDVITAIFQPYSFTAFGATGSNSELPFEATGISLAQALGRVGGLRDERADVRGVYMFRLEEPTNLAQYLPTNAKLTPDGKIPVIYRLDLRDPASFFVAQSFPVRNKDVLYVSNAPMADLQKFMNMVSSMAFSVIGVKNSVDTQN